jgi:hypothetical protein
VSSCKDTDAIALAMSSCAVPSAMPWSSAMSSVAAERRASTEFSERSPLLLCLHFAACPNNCTALHESYECPVLPQKSHARLPPAAGPAPASSSQASAAGSALCAAGGTGGSNALLARAPGGLYRATSSCGTKPARTRISCAKHVNKTCQPAQTVVREKWSLTPSATTRPVSAKLEVSVMTQEQSR